MIGAARIRAYKQAVASSMLEFEASCTGLEIGTRSRIDLLKAQTQHYQSERDYDRAGYLLAILRLRATGGSLKKLRILLYDDYYTTISMSYVDFVARFGLSLGLSVTWQQNEQSQ